MAHAAWDSPWASPNSDFSDWNSPTAPRSAEAWEILALKETPPPHLTGPMAVLGEDLLWLWQHSLSGKGGGRCPYYPSCSRYSRIAVENYGLILGVAMSAERLERCHARHDELGHLEYVQVKGEWLHWNPPMDDAWWTGK